MAVQTVQKTTRAGLNLTTTGVAADAGGTEKWAGTGKEMLWIKNGSGGTYTGTITTEVTIDGIAVSNKTFTIPTGDEAIIGPFPTGFYNDGQGNVNLGHSTTTSVTVCVFTLGT